MLPISVVIPAYDRELLIADALASVRAQTRAPLETIVVDDGSHDGTAAVAAKAGATVIRQANRGVSAARNVGIRAASQPWIAFLDTDDVWAPEKLARQWAAIEAFPHAGLVFCDYAYESGGRLDAPSFLTARDVYSQLVCAASDQAGLLCARDPFLVQFARGNFMTPSTMLVRRSLLFDVGLFDESLHYCEDYELTLRLLSRTVCVLVPHPLVRYCFHAGSASFAGITLACGMVDVLERIARLPEAYDELVREDVRARAGALRRRAGVALLRVGRTLEACRQLERSFRDEPRPQTALAYAAARILELGGPRLHLALRRLWRASRAALAPGTWLQ